MSGSRVKLLGTIHQVICKQIRMTDITQGPVKKNSRSPEEEGLTHSASLAPESGYIFLHTEDHKGLNQATGVSLWLNLPGLGNLFVLRLPLL